MPLIDGESVGFWGGESPKGIPTHTPTKANKKPITVTRGKQKPTFQHFIYTVFIIISQISVNVNTIKNLKRGIKMNDSVIVEKTVDLLSIPNRLNTLAEILDILPDNFDNETKAHTLDMIVSELKAISQAMEKVDAIDFRGVLNA